MDMEEKDEKLKKIISKLELSGLSSFEAESIIKEVENYILSNNKIYIIRVEFSDGDSFSTYDTYELLNCKWTRVDIVNKNIQAIKDHNKFIKNLNNPYNYLKKDRDSILKEASSNWWFVNKDSSFGSFEYNINLLNNNGEIFTIYTPWIGYFANLNDVSMVEI